MNPDLKRVMAFWAGLALVFGVPLFVCLVILMLIAGMSQ